MLACFSDFSFGIWIVFHLDIYENELKNLSGEF